MTIPLSLYVLMQSLFVFDRYLYVNMYLFFAYIYIYISSLIKDLGLGSDHMDKSVSQEQSGGEGYQTPSDPALSLHR
jgi:hypothetical protein